jgi:hypothetical protein
MKMFKEENVLIYIGFGLSIIVWAYIVFAFALAIFGGGSSL